jgi:hypothetical protein
MTIMAFWGTISIHRNPIRRWLVEMGSGWEAGSWKREKMVNVSRSIRLSAMWIF